MKKTVAVMAVMVMVGLAVFAGGNHRAPVSRTFSGASGIYTNGYEPQAISAIFLTSSSNALLAASIVTAAGYTNVLVTAETATNSTSWVDGSAPVALWNGDKLVFTGSAQTNKFTVYFKDAIVR